MSSRGRSRSRGRAQLSTKIDEAYTMPAKSLTNTKVKRILEPRVRNGRTEYLIQWVGQDNTAWVDEGALEQLGCAKLLQEFHNSLIGYNSNGNENKMEQNRNTVTKPSGGLKGEKTLAVVNESNQLALVDSPRKMKSRTPLQIPEKRGPTGFGRNLEPDCILGATDAAGEIMFLIKWHDCEELDLIPAREANKKCPQVVISFYEGRLMPQFAIESDLEEFHKALDS